MQQGIQERSLEKTAAAENNKKKQRQVISKNVMLRRVHATMVTVEGQGVTQSESVFVALRIQTVMRMLHIVMCSLPPLCIFNITSLTTRISKKLTEFEKYILIFSTNLLEIFSILRRTEQGKIKNVYAPSCKVPVILVRF